MMPLKKASDSGKLSTEAKEVMNLPDDISRSYKGSSNGSKTAQELMEENRIK